LAEEEPPMSRYPTPASLAILRGNPGKRRIREEPQPDRGVSCPEPPEWLPPYAQEEWRKVAPSLWGCGLLTVADLATFAVYCQSCHHWHTAEELLAARKRDEGGMLTANGRVHPLVGIARGAAARMLAFAGQFGCTPVARARHWRAGSGWRWEIRRAAARCLSVTLDGYIVYSLSNKRYA
jgi:P27 family predicted phage terminase small subunit